MSQNRTHAVMAQRHEAHDSLDDFPTPPWATRALMEKVIFPVGQGFEKAWEPACNRGHMALPLSEYFLIVRTSDIHDYGWAGQQRVADFLIHGSEDGLGDVDWIITNPPFRLAEQFIFRALDVARAGVAVIVRTSFLESVGRYKNLFNKTPPSIVAQFSERVVMHKGKLSATGSTATAYCWIVWEKERSDPGTKFVWIPPCRKALERASDYPDPAIPAAIEKELI